MFFFIQREAEEAKEGQSKEIACLKERLLMGQEAYKEKYIQCEILESLVTQYKSGRLIFLTRFKSRNYEFDDK